MTMTAASVGPAKAPVFGNGWEAWIEQENKTAIHEQKAMAKMMGEDAEMAFFILCPFAMCGSYITR
jgi:hypothetical protein